MIYLGADHAGFELKEKLKPFLKDLGFEVEDFGNFIYDKQDDYPDFILPVARAVVSDPEQSRGIILGGTGQGEAMVANRIKGARAAVFYGFQGESLDIIRLSREHNNANVLALGARFLSEEQAKKVVKLWLETPFNGEERHKRRIKKIDLC
jgi:ribose 5-phosphate isomerase B